MDLVSVVVPVFNSEKYLEKCVISILQQEYKDLELILIDDGSTDGSGLICDKYAIEDSRIKVIHKKNAGVSSARNSGIEIAKGKYIAFVDSDDYIEKNYLSTAVAKINKHDCDLYVSGILMETWSCGEIVRSEEIGVKNTFNGSITQFLEMMESEYSLMSICGPWCKLYQMGIIKNNKLRFDTSVSFGEDTRFNIDYYSYASTVYFDDAIFYHYRRGNEDSLFSKFKKDTFELHQQEYTKMYNLICEKQCGADFIDFYMGLYTTLLQGCLSEYYRFYQKTTYKEKKVLAKKISEDALVKKCSVQNIVRKRDKAIFILLKIKAYNLVLIIYYLFFRYHKM